MAPQLLNFQEVKVDLPDGRRATVSAVVPLTTSDFFEIEPPVDDTGGASVVGFVPTTGGTIPIDNFYVGSTDTVKVNNQAGENVVVVSLNAGTRLNVIPRRGE